MVIDDASIMIVEDIAGNPVSVACEYGLPNTFLVAGRNTDHAIGETIENEQRFNQILRNLGFDRIVVKDDLSKRLLDPKQLPFVT